jgi:hypothetical protein
MHTKFCLESLKRRDHLEYIGIDGRTILSWILRKLVMDWIHLAQDRDQWWAVVNTVMNLWVPYNVGNFSIS